MNSQTQEEYKRDWSNETAETLCIFITERALRLNDCLPIDEYIPIPKDVYFKKLKEVSPDEPFKTGFLGPLLMEPRSFFAQTKDRLLVRAINEKKEEYNISDENHCRLYRLARSSFRRKHVVDVFGLAPEFFSVVGRHLNMKIAIGNFTQIGEQDYRQLIAPMADSSLALQYRMFHYQTFFDWIHRNKNLL